MIAYWSSIAALLLAIVGCGYLLTATILVRRFARTQTPRTPATTPSVAILKPLHGDDAGLYDNLMSFAEQRYAGAVQIVCGVADAHDPAVAVVERLRGALPRRNIELIVDATRKITPYPRRHSLPDEAMARAQALLAGCKGPR